MPTQEFFPAAFLDFESEPTFPFVLLVLNSPICRGDLYEKCASRAMAIIAADGGGNRIFDYVKKSQVPNLMNQLVSVGRDLIMKAFLIIVYSGLRPSSATSTAYAPKRRSSSRIGAPQSSEMTISTPQTSRRLSSTSPARRTGGSTPSSSAPAVARNNSGCSSSAVSAGVPTRLSRRSTIYTR